MKTRVITALVGIPCIIFCLIVRGWFAELVASVVTVIALNECYRALRAAKYEVSEWGGYLVSALMWPLSQFLGIRDPLLFVVAAMGITMVGVLTGKAPTFPNAAASVYPLFAVFLPLYMLMMMVNTTFGRVPGIALITMAFAIAYGCDTFAYLGGRTFGRHKLCPSVSPKKTVEGAVSGMFGGVIVSLICRAVFVHGLNTPMPGIPAAILLGLIGAFFGQIGDLTASMLKRHSGIKDYGKIFPGHGGIMDRMDSVIFALIVMYCYTLVLH